MYELGEKFLAAVQDEIDKQDLIDTGTMWNAFTQGDANNFWKYDEQRNVVTLALGTILDYPKYLNDGYEIKEGKVNKRGVKMKPRTFIGRKYFDIAFEDFQKVLGDIVQHRFREELKARGLS